MKKIKSEFLDLKDIRLAYCQYGEGRDLIFLHGNSGSKAFFKQFQLTHFSKFHTYALDSRGHGQSKSKDEVLSYEQQSLDVLEFCKARHIDHAAVIGYSDGGNLALWLAVKAPDIFTRIAAISPNTLVSGTKEESLHSIQKFIDGMLKLKRFGLPVKKPLMRFRLMLTDTGITDEDLKRIKSEVLLLYAERDMIKEDHILHIAGMIPNASVKKINNCSHLSIPFQAETIDALQNFFC